MTVDDIAVIRTFNNLREKFPFDPDGVRFYFFPYSMSTFIVHRYCSSYQHMLRIQYEKEKAKDWRKTQEVR